MMVVILFTFKKADALTNFQSYIAKFCRTKYSVVNGSLAVSFSYLHNLPFSQGLSEYKRKNKAIWIPCRDTDFQFYLENSSIIILLRCLSQENESLRNHIICQSDKQNESEVQSFLSRLIYMPLLLVMLSAATKTDA